MTYNEEDGHHEVVPELGLRIGGGDNNGDYVKLRKGPDEFGLEEGFDGSVEPSSPRRRGCFCYWLRFVLLLGLLGLLGGVFVKWVGPFLMDKVSMFVKYFDSYCCNGK